MENKERKIIEIPEITRVEGHSAVVVDLIDGRVDAVKLDVFEGTRFFEKIVVGHKYYEIPHITSRVCAICSTGHVIAAIRAIENAIGMPSNNRVEDLRELMHLGMIIESHATHLYALALPDYVGAQDLMDFASRFPREFQNWSQLRKLGSSIQTLIGGRAYAKCS
jgi:sulfhydrogenase subunit alpha